MADVWESGTQAEMGHRGVVTGNYLRVFSTKQEYLSALVSGRGKGSRAERDEEGRRGL
jgi:hypothetical protein